MSFAIFLVGFAIFTGGMAWALISVGVAHVNVMIFSTILLGLGIVTGVSYTRGKDPS